MITVKCSDCSKKLEVANPCLNIDVRCLKHRKARKIELQRIRRANRRLTRNIEKLTPFLKGLAR